MVSVARDETDDIPASKQIDGKEAEAGHVVGPQVAVAIITSSPVQHERLQQIAIGWVSRSSPADLFVVGISDVEVNCTAKSRALGCVETRQPAGQTLLEVLARWVTLPGHQISNERWT